MLFNAFDGSVYCEYLEFQKVVLNFIDNN